MSDKPTKPPVKIRPIRILGKPLFDGGSIRASHGIAIAFSGDPKTLHPFLDRHFCGDWGALDEEDTDRNDEALFDGSRIFSAYHAPASPELERGEQKIWIITEAENEEGKREQTTVLYPHEY